MLNKMLRILITLLVYIVILSILYLFEPSLMFDESGKLKTIGYVDENKSLFSLYLLSPILILFIYIITLVIWRN
jgi:hypothetical protein